MPQRIRHILKPPGDHEQFLALAEANGLLIINKISKEPRSPVALQEIFSNADDTVGVHYVEDGLAELSYIQVGGPDLEKYSRIIVDGLPVFSENELFSSWDKADSIDQKIDAIHRLGVAADGQPAEPYSSRIRQALTDSDPDVRAAGLVAFSYNLWGGMKLIIENIRDNDPDEDLQMRARVALDVWERTTNA
jgi:hypothetical protein